MIRKLIKKNEVLREYYTILENSSKCLQFLDLSCGTRTDIKKIVEYYGHKWTGVDQIDSPNVLKADVHNLPFKKEQFDIVYSSASFEHYYNPWKVAREVSRVLKQGGYFLGLIAFIQPWHGDSYYHFSHLGVKQMLDEIKFKIIDIKPGDINGVSYLIQCLFPKPIGFIGNILSLYGNILFWGRKN